MCAVNGGGGGGGGGGYLTFCREKGELKIPLLISVQSI